MVAVYLRTLKERFRSSIKKQDRGEDEKDDQPD
jgi:hypothetical protein